MAPPLLTLQSIHLGFGGTPLLTGADLAVHERDRICLVGRNGSGKSTLLKIAAGLVEADSGERFVHPGATIRYLEQEPDMSDFDTLDAYAVSGLAPGDDAHRVHTLMAALQVDGSAPAATVSGGEARRAALVRVLASAPDILLLDEPTNHLDLPAIEWLEGELARSRSALVLISHDRRFLATLARRTVWIDRGETRAVDRGFADFEAWRDETLAQEEADRHKLDRKIERENHWIVHGVSGRRKRNQKRLRDLDALRAEKRRLAERAARTGTPQLAVAQSERSGKQVLEAEAISKAFDSRPIVRDLSLTVHRQDRIGVVGPNGIGKTTLLKLLTQQMQPDAGHVRLGTRLDIVTLDQKREQVAPTTTLSDALTDGRGDSVIVGTQSRHVIGYMKDFMFLPEQARAPIGRLSGGERGRLMLARAFARPSNTLILDEPTNDLDLETLDLLQDLLGDYDGTVFLVSHDRDFLDRIVSTIIVGCGDGRWEVAAGGYSDAERILKAAGKPGGANTDAPNQKPRDDRPKGGSSRRKLSFKDTHALKVLPEEIAALESEIDTLESRLAGPDFYARDPEGFHAATAALGTAQEALSAKEEEWLRLEMLREEIEAERAGAKS
ncbi:MAG: ATP-binding cassette domain-containing protein [Pseudomonadota bacterium]